MFTKPVHRLGHHCYFLLRLFDGSGLQPAIRRDPQLLLGDDGERFLDQGDNLLRGFDMVRMHINNTQAQLFRERLLFEKIIQMKLPVGDLQVVIIDGKIQQLRIDAIKLSIADVREKMD